MQLSPLQKVKERFGDAQDPDRTESRVAAKDELVKAVMVFVKKGDLLDDDFSDKGLERVSNRKLLKLLELAETVSEEFGSRSALIDATVELEGRAKDADYREHLEGFRLPQLYDHYQTARRRSDRVD